MRFRDDERGAAVQVGAVLLLGFVVVSLSLYQATVVPQENKEVEFEHSQRVQSDVQELRNAILRTANTGSSVPAAVELGTRYTSRTLFVNPPPASGRLSTADVGEVTIHNATADDLSTNSADYPETADYWNGSSRTYQTASLVYEPNYARYQNPPTTVYEHGVVYNRFERGNVSLTGQPVVSGTRISLVALSGSLSRSGTGSLSVTPQAVSVSTRTVSVSNSTNNVSVFLPTGLSADAWRDLLRETGEFDTTANESNGGYVYRVADRPGGVELYFERNATYQLELAKVGVGSDVGDTDPAYLTNAEDLTGAPFTDRTYPFEVEVRDKYNNPVSTVVEADAADGVVPDGTVVEPGRYRYRYEASASSGEDWVNVSYGDQSSDPFEVGATTFNGSKPENVQYNVTVQAAAGGGGGGGGGAASDVSYVGGSAAASGGGGAPPTDSAVSFDIENTGSSPITLTAIAVNSTTSSATAIGGPGGSPGRVRVNGTERLANTFSIGNTKQDFDTTATVASGGTATVELDRFEDGGGGGVNMSGENITVTLFFSDGTKDTYVISVP